MASLSFKTSKFDSHNNGYFVLAQPVSTQVLSPTCRCGKWYSKFFNAADFVSRLCFP